MDGAQDKARPENTWPIVFGHYYDTEAWLYRHCLPYSTALIHDLKKILSTRATDTLMRCYCEAL